MYNPNDTIVAVATPPGEGALAIVRLSGAQAKTILEKMMPQNRLKHRVAVVGRVITQGKITDQVVAIYYQAPHSYTGEDLVEIICHGGYVIAGEIVNLAVGLGARLAEPGEFTMRAFLNGKLDLTQAEAVNAVIRGRTPKAKEVAMLSLEGKLSKRLERCQQRMIELLTLLEIQIDFVEEGVELIPPAQAHQLAGRIADELNRLLSTYNIGRMVEGRTMVVIAGAPNTGKSTLFNALLDSQRAIVTDIPGTTRDFLTEYIEIDGFPVTLVDTAGLGESTNLPEEMGMRRSRELIDSSDLVLFVLDASRPYGPDDVWVADLLTDRQFIPVINKVDLVSPEDLNSAMWPFPDGCMISALHGTGLDKLRELLRQRLVGDSRVGTDAVLLSQRQYNCANMAAAKMADVMTGIRHNEPLEIIAASLHAAIDSIDEILGVTTPDDILEQIFSRFCIGK